MNSTLLLLSLLVTFVTSNAQFPGGPWGQGPPSTHNRPSFGKPTPFGKTPFSRPSPNYGGKPGGGNSGNNGIGSSPHVHHHGGALSDDPIPPNPNLDGSSQETQQLPAKLPILAPNGVVEIYNRVVDDLIKRLEVSYRKREIDPMNVIIRPTPNGPVRVPGHLQKRPFRRPGAPLYRSSNSNSPSQHAWGLKKARNIPIPVEVASDTSTLPALTVVDEKGSFRGSGKISKGPLGEEVAELPAIENTPTTLLVVIPSVSPNQLNSSSFPVPSGSSVEEPSSEEHNLFRGRSEEYLSDDEDDDLGIVVEEKEDKNEKARTNQQTEKKAKKDVKKEESEEDEDETPKTPEPVKKNVDSLIKRYQNKNVNDVGGKTKYSKGGSNKKKESAGDIPPTANKKKTTDTKNNNNQKEEEIVEEDDDEDDFQDDLDEDGPNQGNSGYYPPQSKPNAVLTGLSKIKRTSDVSVTVDARSAIITARLLVGPLNVNINDSVEPLERNVRATIPELEAELILMERHGVVFLQRFTLDRAYGQDVEISMPKSKLTQKKKSSLKQGGPGVGPPGMVDPQVAQQRFQTKMAAHISMEVVKLLRSGNLRVNMMRTAQSSMSKLKLPIKAPSKGTSSKKKIKKDKPKSKETN